MRTRNMLLLAGVAMLLLVGAALWVLLQPPRGHAQTVRYLSAGNPALDVRFHYDPNVFRPAPYDSRAEYPLRLDAADWSFYGKRIQGVGEGLMNEPPKVVYNFVNDANASIYTEYYKLHQDGATQYQDVQLAGHKGLRQRLSLSLAQDSEGWPSYFPQSVRGDSVARFLAIPNERAEKAFSGIPEVERQKEALKQKDAVAHPVKDKAYLYGWALFVKSDLFFFQAVGPRPLTDSELAAAEEMISALEFNAMLAPAAAPSTPVAPGAAPSTIPPAGDKPAAPGPGADGHASPAPPAVPPANPGQPPAAPPAAPGAPPATPGG